VVASRTIRRAPGSAEPEILWLRDTASTVEDTPDRAQGQPCARVFDPLRRTRVGDGIGATLRLGSICFFSRKETFDGFHVNADHLGSRAETSRSASGSASSRETVDDQNRGTYPRLRPTKSDSEPPAPSDVTLSAGS